MDRWAGNEYPNGHKQTLTTKYKNMNRMFEQIESLFHPRSVAIVGLPRGLKTGKLFLLALQDQKFCESGLPFFDSAERAMRTYASVKRYRDWQEKQMKS